MLVYYTYKLDIQLLKGREGNKLGMFVFLQSLIEEGVDHVGAHKIPQVLTFSPYLPLAPKFSPFFEADKRVVDGEFVQGDEDTLLQV